MERETPSWTIGCPPPQIALAQPATVTIGAPAPHANGPPPPAL